MPVYTFKNLWLWADRAKQGLETSRRTALGLVVIIAITLEGCALQPPYKVPETNAEGTRLRALPVSAGEAAQAAHPWWLTLHDPAVDQLAAQALQASPTLSRAIAVVDEARAMARGSRAARLPSVGLEGSAVRERTEPTRNGGSTQSTASAGLTLSWEADLFGRVRNTAVASAYRLDSRRAEAEAVRLALIADVADAVTGLRACNYSASALSVEIASRQNDLSLTRRRRAAGFAADVDVALAETGLATAQTTLAQRRQECATYLNTLVVLTGTSSGEITTAMASAPEQPDAPQIPDGLPATLLRTNPGVVAAERNVAAAWADIAVARAERMPRLDLTAALSGQWVRALGSTNDSSLGSIGAGLTLPVFDGGRGKAAVSASEARYRAAVADLDIALRGAARDAENALAAGDSAQSRTLSAQRAAQAAVRTLKAREAQWQTGTISQFEIEEARRQLATALDNVITASRDQAQAWVALMRATGAQTEFQESSYR